MRLKDIRQYKGKFTGKLVKPNVGQSTIGFAKDDPVMVMHADDYKEYLYTIKEIKATWKDENSDDIIELREIAHIKFENRKLNYAWKEAVRLFVKKNKHLLERRYDRQHQSY